MLERLERLLLFLTVLFLPTQLGKHFWPEFSSVYSLKVDYLSPTVYFWDLLVVGICFLGLLLKKPFNRLVLNLFFLFVLTQLLSLIVSQNLAVGLVRLEQYLVAGLFGVYIASSRFSEIKPIIFWGLFWSIMGEAVLAIAQFFKGATLGFWILGERGFSIATPAIAKFDFHGLQFLRPYATFPHPNVLAGYMVISLCVIATILKPISLKIPMIILSVLAGATTLLTVSRSALLAGSIFAMLLLSKKGRIVLGIAIIILFPILYTRFSSIFTFDNLALIRREELSEMALTLFSDSPVLGIGLNNFILALSSSLLTGPSRFLQPVHNIFLLMLSETGLLGLLGWFGLLGYPIFRLIKLYPKSPVLKPLLVIFGVIFFLGLFDHYFLTLPQGYRLLFLIWGLSFINDVRIIK